MNKKSIKAGLSSYDKQIKIHESKIKKEKEKEDPNLNLLDYWKKEIETLKENRKKLSKRL
ncbi:hypothetical protein HYT25_03860 [Candidatus Pacearchaeota archaeon]|nr:hypothetical protein [Candidatus Pacearchaeota archaeon]